MAKTSEPTSKFGPFLSFLGGSVALGIMAAGIATPGVAVADIIASDAVNLASSVSAELPLITLQSRSTIYAKQGDDWVSIANFYNKNRIPVTYDEISQYAKDAVVAVENPSFWDDSGVNVWAAARALVQNQVTGSIASGASTITMQLVKNQVQEQAQNAGDEEAEEAATEQTITRKLSDMWLALGMTKEYTKEEILTQYLNISFMGGQIYGIEAAAEYYFNTTAANLTLPQAALLAGMLTSPNTYAPDNEDNLDQAKTRRDYVLSKMLEHGYITQDEYQAAVDTAVEVDITPVNQGCALAGENAFFCDYVVASIKQSDAFGDSTSERGATLNRGGLEIYTTLDLDLQAEAYESSQYWIDPSSDNPFANASAAVEVGTGRILVMVQNRDYSVSADTTSTSETAVNYAADYAYGGSLGFQPGSSFKVFTLLDWLEEGHTLNETVSSSNNMTFDQTDFTDSCSDNGLAGSGTFTLSNSVNWGYSSMTVEQATVRSVNTAYMSMAKELDLCNIESTATSMGVTRADGTALDMNLSDVYGSGQVNTSPLTMASAFATIANNGVYCEETPFDSVVNSLTGKEYDVGGTNCKQVLTSDVTSAATVALEATLDADTGVTASGANPEDGTAVAGKTGTSDYAVQNWLVGYSTEVSLATWVGDPLSQVSGYDASTYSHGYAGVYLKSYLWHDIMTAIDKEYPGSDFPEAPDSLVEGVSVAVPNVSGLSSDTAQSVLSNAGFTSTIASERVTSTVEEGLVAYTNPSGGSYATKGQSITITLSAGPSTSMPSVVGMSQDEALTTLQDAGFTSVSTTEVEVTDSSQVGTVVSTSPEAGATTSLTDSILLTIGKQAAEPSASTSASA